MLNPISKQLDTGFTSCPITLVPISLQFIGNVTYGDRIPSYSAFGIMTHNYDMQLRQCSYFVRRQSILASTCRINYY